MKKAVFLLIAAVLIIGAIFFAYKTLTKSKTKVIETAKVSTGSVQGVIVETGIIKPQVGAVVKIGTRATGTIVKMNVKIDQLEIHGDNRGVVFEPIEDESIIFQQNCHVVISVPGAIRGNHYHVSGTETLAVMGPALLRFKQADRISDVEVPSSQIYKFVISPNVTHAIKNTGNQNNILIAFNTIQHDRGNPDLIREIVMDS